MPKKLIEFGNAKYLILLDQMLIICRVNFRNTHLITDNKYNNFESLILVVSNINHFFLCVSGFSPSITRALIIIEIQRRNESWSRFRSFYIRVNIDCYVSFQKSFQMQCEVLGLIISWQKSRSKLAKIKVLELFFCFVIV